MATRKPNRRAKSETLDLKGVTKRQANIIHLKTKLDESASEDIKPFTKYKIITYIFDIVFTPYALYRIWSKKSTFNQSEKVVQTAVCIIFLGSLFYKIIN